MVRITLSSIIKSAIITAFTIAAALIWKDVITDLINLAVPAGGGIVDKLIAAVLATALVIVGLILFVETESEVELVFRKLKKGKKK